MLTAIRTHEICAAHRLFGHQGSCGRIHGHNYVLEVEVERCSGGTDETTGMVMDFSEIRERLCSWLDRNWDHRLLLWDRDPLASLAGLIEEHAPGSVLAVPFNPTAENMARHLLHQVFPALLEGTGCRSPGLTLHETGKCKVRVQGE